LMTNDSHIAISQQDIAAATGMSKSKISDLKKSKRHLPLVEASHAK
jgi:predicted transcriptional regulator